MPQINFEKNKTDKQANREKSLQESGLWKLGIYMWDKQTRSLPLTMHKNRPQMDRGL